LSFRITVAALACALPLAALAQPGAAPSFRASVGALQVERLATLEYPWGLAVLPDGRVLVTEKPGRLRIWADGRLSEPVRGLPPVIHLEGTRDQGGLMDVAADPDFARNRRIYLSFIEGAESPPDGAKHQADARGDLYSLGHRNVLAAAFEPGSGRLWAFEMGPLGGDEANVVRAGRNYG
jgi:glucose/arabinose dehydrogenase